MSNPHSAGRRQNASKAGPAAKLKTLREAADAGTPAIERGDCREFSSMDDLVAHLHQVAERAICVAKRRRR